MKIERRDFLKGAGLLTALSLVACLPLPEGNSQEETVTPEKLHELQQTVAVTLRLSMDANLSLANAMGYSVTFDQIKNIVDNGLKGIQSGLDPMQKDFWSQVGKLNEMPTQTPFTDPVQPGNNGGG